LESNGDKPTAIKMDSLNTAQVLILSLEFTSVKIFFCGSLRINEIFGVRMI